MRGKQFYINIDSSNKALNELIPELEHLSMGDLMARLLPLKNLDLALPVDEG